MSQFVFDTETLGDWAGGAWLMHLDSKTDPPFYAVLKFGYSEVIDDTYNTIWPLDSIYPWDTIRSGVAMEILSSSSDDTAAGSGARSVQVAGLDGAGNRKRETVSLNGTNPVSLSDTWCFIGRASVQDGDAAGDITIRTQSGSVTTAYIPVGENQTQQAVWKVPKGYRASLQVHSLVVSNASNKVGEVELYARYPTADNVGFRELITYPFSGNANLIAQESGLPRLFPELTEIDFRAIRASGTGDTSVFCEFDIIHIKNEYFE